MATNPKSTSKSSAAKTTSKASEKPALKVIASEADVETPTAETTVIRKPQFIERVVERSEKRKRDVKPSVEAALAVLAEAIAAGEDLILPPLGKIKVVKSREIPGGAVHTIKLRLANPTEKSDSEGADNDDDGLAEADD